MQEDKMYCYFCEKRRPGGTNYGNTMAYGICRHCGVGVCLEHSHRDSTPGAPLLCFECAKLLVTAGDEPISARKQPQVRLNLN
jgi:hypothetical protein